MVTAQPSPSGPHGSAPDESRPHRSAPDDGGAQRIDLVLEGGGVKGIALAGALEVLEERGYSVNRVAGSSAGAIAGALITAGIPASTMVQILRETDYRRFQDGPFWTRFLLGKAISILLHNGVYRGKYLTSWLTQQLQAHGDREWTGTFADLLYRDPDPERELPPSQLFRLVITASDLSAGRLRFLPRDAEAFGIDPSQLRVVDAVRASVSIPLVFRPAKWKNAFGRTAWLVDGGLLSNFPVSVFDLPAGQSPRWPTFGIKLSARPEADFGIANRITGPLSFGKAVLDTVTGFHDRLHIDASHSLARTIFIDTAAVRPTKFDLSEADHDLLYESGRQAATDFLDGTETREPWDFERYVARYRSPDPS
ncbi:patatin-like phospholipase family protein [Brachybacterium sp. FME24]|uniref:patatin-like phospholipase family protein n=1 Tax=Brachybacterium sp. FME24 TaxID=2742605 RepID=UPI0018689238|nr:patatin-like phospholipase family protein [Brachybacterium sp. FME24]